MGLLSLLGLKKKEDNKIEKELEIIKTTLEEQNIQDFQIFKTDVRTIFSEIQYIKLELKDINTASDKHEFKLNKLAEKIMETDNEMLKVVYKDELNLTKKEIEMVQNEIKDIKESQNKITEKFIDFALNKRPIVSKKEIIQNEETLTEFEEEILSKYSTNITTDMIVEETKMSKGHISRILKALHKKGYLSRKRKGKEYIYNKL